MMDKLRNYKNAVLIAAGMTRAMGGAMENETVRQMAGVEHKAPLEQAPKPAQNENDVSADANILKIAQRRQDQEEARMDEIRRHIAQLPDTRTIMDGNTKPEQS